MDTCVSVVIVCMNNLKNLYPCLDSIIKYTNVSYEILVTAFMFSHENLEKARHDYPNVIFIESNDLRGFSENNNLALRQAKGKYCFIVNDDTFIKSPVIDSLVNSFNKLPNDVAIVSPNIKYPDGREQICGRREYNWLSWLKSLLRIKEKSESTYENQNGLFQSYNISGAAFLIKTDVFRKLGWFDETFYFCPEDIVLSDTINKQGMKVYVDSENVIFHIASGTSSKIQSATMPAHTMGALIFYSHGNPFLRFFLASCVFIIRGIYMLGHGIKSLGGNTRSQILFKGNLNVCRSIFSKHLPKDLFIKYYKKIVRI